MKNVQRCVVVLYKPIDTDDIGDRKLNGENTAGPLSPAPELVGTSATPQDSLGKFLRCNMAVTS